MISKEWNVIGSGRVGVVKNGPIANSLPLEVKKSPTKGQKMIIEQITSILV